MPAISHWSPSSLVYQEIGNDVEMDNRVVGRDLSFFDELDQPPPVHIFYPRPKINEFATNKAHQVALSLSLGLSIVLLSCRLSVISLCLLPAPS